MTRAIEHTRTQGRIPEFDLGDRIRKAIETSGLSVQEVADYMELNRNSPGRWIHGHNKPNALQLRAIAEVTGVDVAWLRWGRTEPLRGSGASSSMAELRTFNPKDAGSRRSKGGVRRAPRPLIIPRSMFSPRLAVA